MRLQMLGSRRLHLRNVDWKVETQMIECQDPLASEFSRTTLMIFDGRDQIFAHGRPRRLVNEVIRVVAKELESRILRTKGRHDRPRIFPTLLLHDPQRRARLFLETALRRDVKGSRLRRRLPRTDGKKTLVAWPQLQLPRDVDRRRLYPENAFERMRTRTDCLETYGAHRGSAYFEPQRPA